MNNPFIHLLKDDNRSAIVSSILATIFFLALYYVINRDSFVILLFVFIVGALYILGFLKSIQAKQRLLMMFPASSKHLIQAVFTLVIRSITIIALFTMPFYFLATAFDEMPSPLSELVILYVVVIGNTLLFNVLFVWLYCSVQQRSWLSLIQFTSLLVVTLISFSILTTFERMSLHIVWQLVVFVTVYSGSVFYFYKRTMRDYLKFNLL